MDYKKEKHTTLIGFVISGKKSAAFKKEMQQKAEKYVYAQHKFPHTNIYVDAFRHTFSSAVLSFRNTEATSQAGGEQHEVGNMSKTNNKSITLPATIMDLHNNQMGRQIAQEVKNELKQLEKYQSFTEQQVENMIAYKVFNRMGKGELITSEKDKRISEYKKNPDKILGGAFGDNLKKYIKEVELPTGFAANVVDVPEKKSELQLMFENTLAKKGIQVKNEDYEKLQPEDRVFHKNELGDLTSIKDQQLLKQVITQFTRNGNRLPEKSELDARVNTGELIYVHEYIKRDGTKVHGYYRRKPEKTK